MKQHPRNQSVEPQKPSTRLEGFSVKAGSRIRSASSHLKKVGQLFSGKKHKHSAPGDQVVSEDAKILAGPGPSAEGVYPVTTNEGEVLEKDAPSLAEMVSDLSRDLRGLTYATDGWSRLTAWQRIRSKMGFLANRAAMMGARDLARQAVALESYMSEIGEDPERITQPVLKAVSSSARVLASLSHGVADNQENRLSELNAVMAGLDADLSGTAPSEQAPGDLQSGLHSGEEALVEQNPANEGEQRETERPVPAEEVVSPTVPPPAIPDPNMNERASGLPGVVGGSEMAFQKAAVFLDEGGKIVAAQPRCTEWFGWDPEELMRLNIEALLRPGCDKEIGRFLKSQEGVEPAQSETLLQVQARRKDGTEFPAKLTLKWLSKNPLFCWSGAFQALPVTQLETASAPSGDGTVPQPLASGSAIPPETPVSGPEERAVRTGGPAWRNSFLLSKSLSERKLVAGGPEINEMDRQSLLAQLEREGEARKKLEQELQSLVEAVGQAKLEAEEAAAERAEAACRKQEERVAQLQEELNGQYEINDELSKKLALEQQSGMGSNPRVQQLEEQLRQETSQLEQAKADLKQRAEEWQSLESELRAEVAEAQQARDELHGQLANEQQKGAQAQERIEEQTKRLAESAVESEAAEVRLKEQARHQERLERELGEQLKTSQAAVERAEASAKEKAQQFSRVEEELAGRRLAEEDLQNKLRAAQESTAQAQQRAQESERLLAEMSADLESARAALEKQAAERQLLQTEWSGQLQAMKAAGEQAETIGQEKAARCSELERELGELEQRLREGVSGLARVTADLQKERGDHQRAEDRASSAVAQLQGLHEQLGRHLESERASQNRISDLEKAVQERDEALARTTADLQKETADRQSAEEQLRVVGDLDARLEANQGLFEEAKKTFKRTLQDLESRLQASLSAAAESESRLQQETGERQRLEEALVTAQRKLQERTENSQSELSKLQATLQLEEFERKRLEGDLLHSRHVSMKSARAGGAVLNSLRREMRQLIERLRQSACCLLQTELPDEQKRVVENMLESALLLQTSLEGSANLNSDPDAREASHMA